MTNLSGRTAIAGLGITEQGRVYGPSAIGFAADALRLALDDAGLAPTDLDGLLVNPGLTWGPAGQMGSFSVQQAMGLRDLRLSASMSVGGATAGAMLMHAAQAIEAGMATAVACVFSDAPLKPPRSGGEGKEASSSAYAFAGDLPAAYGAFGVNGLYALVARRHMHQYGTTSDQLGQIAVSQRAFAVKNPQAQFFGKRLTLEEYHASRFVTEPFHLYDCCLVSNGGVAVIVTSAERARELRQPPVYLLGMGQGHPGGDPLDTLSSGARLAGDTALRMAGVKLADIDFCELYDCYTFTVLVTLEDYGFCKKGEGGPFVERGRIGADGELPVNTGGGQLSSFYMWGMTPISEAVIQIRGQGGDRQVKKHDCGLVSGNGGVLSTHSTLIVSRHAS
ncbi:MAG TPA: thiolase family protein [Candidatus Bathyarchaeia archaeon]|nr:thiolase family protein [Candidatus Bathyarchaeia archaeon]